MKEETEKLFASSKLLSGGSDFLNQLLYSIVPRILVALLVLWIGLKLIKILSKFMRKMFARHNTDGSLQSFLLSLTEITLKILLLIAVLGMIGIQTTSFIAMIGAAGLAVGMALQGTLQNFAGGVMVLFFKPYKVGDYIEASGVTGTVINIQIFNTIVRTDDLREVIIPNSDLATKMLINHSTSPIRRVSVPVGIAYGESVDKARKAILEMAKSYELLSKDYEPVVVVTGLADSSVNLQLRVWVNNADYWTVSSYLHQAVYEKLMAEGIEIPFNQMDIHLKKD